MDLNRFPHLDDDQRQLVENVLATHRLEGVEPTEDDIVALVQIATGERTADEVVAEALSGYAVPSGA